MGRKALPVVQPSKWASYKEQQARIGNYLWGIPRLFQLASELEPMDVPIAHLNIADAVGPFTLREMAGQIKAVNDADLRYPIILDENGQIMDGRHRVIKAIVTGETTIKAVRFDENPEPCEVCEE